MTIGRTSTTHFSRAFLQALDIWWTPIRSMEKGEAMWSFMIPSMRRVAIFEAKYTKTLGNLEKDCDTALQQIDDRMYAKEYEDDYDQIFCYGISFFKKRCMVKEKG